MTSRGLPLRRDQQAIVGYRSGLTGGGAGTELLVREMGLIP